MLSDPILLRGLERIVAVIVGGVAVYLGYRLFLAIPDQSAVGGAELSLSKDRRLVLTRIGPGVFFALFGAAIVVASFFFGVTGVRGPDGAASLTGFDSAPGAAAESGPRPSPAAAFERPEGEAAELARVAARQRIAFLNQIEERLVEGLSDAQAERAARELRATRLALMQAVWADGWGDPQEFPIWLDMDPRPPRPDFERARAFLEAKE